MFEKQVEYVFEASLSENDRAWLGGTFLGLKVSMVGIGNFLRDIKSSVLGSRPYMFSGPRLPFLGTHWIESA